MKNGKTLLTKGLLMAVIAMMLTACNGSGSSKSKVQMIVDETVKELPTQDNIGEISAIKCEKKMVVFNYNTDAQSFPLAKAKDSGDLIKRTWRMSFFDPDDKNKSEFLSSLIDEGYGVKVCFDEEGTKVHHEITFSNDELQTIKKQPLTNTQQLNIQIELTNAALPKQIDNVTTLVRTELDDTNMVYVFDIDEDKLTIDAMKSDEATYRSNIERTLANEIANPLSSTGMFFKQVIRAGKGVKYNYCGKNSGKSFDVELTNSQLRQMALNVE
jgi:hypothetical protein